MKKQLTQTILQHSSILMLTTIGDGGLWTSPSYFTVDSSNNIYFLSEPHSQHMKNIWVNPYASIEIQLASQDSASLQLIGKVSQVQLTKKQKKLQEILFMLHKGADAMKKEDIKMVKLTPEKILLKTIPIQIKNDGKHL